MCAEQVSWRSLLALLVMLLIPSGIALAQQYGLQLDINRFSSFDEQTETAFDIDSGPILDVAFRIQEGAHSLVLGLGYHKWERKDASLRAELEVFPIFFSYRFSPWHDQPITLFVGGGIGGMLYEAKVGTASSENGRVAAVEPIVGVEFFANKKIRLDLSTKYSVQIFDDESDTCFFNCASAQQDPLEPDMSGLYVSVSFVFMWGDF